MDGCFSCFCFQSTSLLDCFFMEEMINTRIKLDKVYPEGFMFWLLLFHFRILQEHRCGC